MKRFTTRNSVYEVEGPCVRRVRGRVPESPLGVLDGEWVEFESVDTVRVWWAEPVSIMASAFGLTFVSSPVTRVEDLDESVPDADPAPCEAVVFGGSQTDPPAYCDEDAEENEEFCAVHLRGME